MSGEQEQESIEAEEAAVPGSSAVQYTVSSVHQVLSLEREARRRRAEQPENKRERRTER